MKKTFLILAIFFCAFSAAADSIYVQPSDGEGVEAYMRTTVDHLVKSFVTRESHSVASSADSADLVLSPKVMKLGNAYFLTIDKKKGGKVLFSSSMKAANAEELDTVAKRVVRSVLNEQKIEDSATVADVTAEEETKNTRRYQATRQWRFLFGPVTAHDLKSEGGYSFFDIGYAWGLDPHYDVTLDFKTSGLKEGAYYTGFLLGLTYYSQLGKHSPYYKAGVGRVTAAAADDTAFFISDDSFSGWGGEVGVGYKFFRTSTVNIVVELTHGIAFGKTAESDSSPGLTTIGFGLYY
jgi:hypothetical protein